MAQLRSPGQTVAQKARWIQKQQHYFRELVQPSCPPVYVSGETHYYLGRQYRLKALSGGASKPAHDLVRLSGPYLEVYAGDRSSDRVEALVTRWYRRR